MKTSHYRKYLTALTVSLLLAGGNVPAAYTRDAITLISTAEQEVVETSEQGEQQLKRIPAEKVVPGKDVIYTTEFENVGAEAADNIVINNPIPEHTRYKPGSAAGDDTVISYSIDGGKHFDTPENLVVTEPDGTTRTARVAEYTTIRWVYTRPLEPGQKSAVRFRVVVQ